MHGDGCKTCRGKFFYTFRKQSSGMKISRGILSSKNAKSSKPL